MSPAVYRYAAALLIVSLALDAGCRRRAVLPTNPEDLGEPARAAVKPSEPRLPRRLLVISISNYAFLNPLAAPAADQTQRCADKLAAGLKVPHQKDAGQVAVATDMNALASGQLLDKDNLTATYERFFATSKTSDRIVVYFGGHALMIDGKAYLAPVNGDPIDPRSLIPVADFYAKLKACSAIQKVVIWDVCRANAGRRPEGKGSEPMTAALARALTAAPAGVEVVTTCQPGENALDIGGRPGGSSGAASRGTGSLFLEAVNWLGDKKRIELRPQTASDPIPVAEWVAPIASRVAEATIQADRKQTVRYFSGQSHTSDDTVDEPARPAGSQTTLAEVQAIEMEFRVPPFSPGASPLDLASFPFRDDIIRAYKADVSLDEIKKNKAKYPFRIITLNALQTVRDVWVFKAKSGLVRRESIPGPVTEAVKREIRREQEAWSIAILKLEEADRALEAVAGARKDQPKRWQVHYDYARAVVKARWAFASEYDKLMGDVVTETLPPIDKAKGLNSYRLVQAEKMKSKKDVQKVAEEAREAYAALIAAHKDSPWALQAKKEMEQLLGLAWEPAKK